MVKHNHVSLCALVLIMVVSITQISFSTFGPASAATASVAINNSYTFEGVTFINSTSITLTLSVDPNANITKMRFSNDNSVWSDWEPYATTKSWNLTAGDGDKTVFVQFQDDINQVSSINTQVILDMTPPTAYAVYDLISLLDRSVWFDASYSYDLNGIANFTWNFGDGNQSSGITLTHAYPAIGNYTGTLTVTDLAGNTATDTFNVWFPTETISTPTPIQTIAPTLNPTETPSSTGTPPIMTPPFESADQTLTVIIVIFVVGAILIGLVAIRARNRNKAVL